MISLPFSRSPRTNLVRFLAKSDGKYHIQFASHEFVFLILQLENSRSVLNNKAQQAFWKLFYTTAHVACTDVIVIRQMTSN